MTVGSRDTTDVQQSDGAPPWQALPVVLTGLFLATLDFFILPVALPNLQDDLGSSSSQLQLVVAVYGVAYACLLITGGRLGDLFGHRRTFVFGLVGFLVASVACGLAPTNGFLIGARAAQGVAAAAMSPPALSMIGALFSGRHRARALTAWSVTMGVAAVFGQLIGGALIALAPGDSGWRWCFLINVPVGGIALLLTRRLVPADRPAHREGLDVPGTALVTLALAALVVPLVEGREHGWPLWAWTILVCCPLLTTALAVHLVRAERRGRPVIVSPSLFRLPAFGSGVLVQAALWCGQAALFFVLAIYLQRGLGLSAIEAGGVFSVLGAGFLLGSLCAAEVARRTGPTVVSLGAVVMALGLTALVALVGASGSAGRLLLLAPGLLVEGIGMGLAVAPLVGVVLARIPATSAGGVSGALSAVAQAGTAVGVAAVGVFFYAGLRTADASSYLQAFERSLWLLVVFDVAVAAMAYRLARQARGEERLRA